MEDMENSIGTGRSYNTLLKLYGEFDKLNVVVTDPKMEVGENITIQTDSKK